MTVDADSWSSLLQFYSIRHRTAKVEKEVSFEDGTERLLALFSKHDIHVTFFVPGRVAEDYAKVIRKAGFKGHEIACHGHDHDKNEFLAGREYQKRQIMRAVETISSAAGTEPRGFRAPCLRLNGTTLKILDEIGFKYDSSILPTFVPGYYGSLGAPLAPYHPSGDVVWKEGSLRILEIPVSVNPVFRLPLSAAWMRNFGLSWVKIGVRTSFALGLPVVFYIHPRDVVPLPKIDGVPWHMYRNIGDSAVRMLDEIISYAKRLGARFLTGSELARHHDSPEISKHSVLTGESLS